MKNIKKKIVVVALAIALALIGGSAVPMGGGGPIPTGSIFIAR